MHRTSLKRIAGGVTALALTAVGSLALAPPADADVVGLTSKALSQRTIVNDSNNQEAGNLELKVSSAVEGDTIEITIDDAAGDECSSATSFVEFSANPSVSSSPSGAVKSFARDGAGDCDAAGRDNRLTLELNDIAAETTITVSGIKYDTGSDVAIGAVRVSVDGSLDADSSNATIAIVDRIDGATRFTTAANLALAANPCADHVYVASGRNYPDALAANFLVAAQPDAALVLTEPTALSAEARDAIKKMGATKVTILGGPDAIKPAVATALQNQEVAECPTGDDADGDTKLVVDRIEGTTRYDTARKVALAGGAGNVGTFDPAGDTCTADEAKKTAILTTGENFADALAIGPLAFTGAVDTGDCGDGNPIPVLLTQPNSLYESIVETLNTLGVDNVVVLGGQEAVSNATVGALTTAKPGLAITRIEGPNRQETARNIANLLLKRGFDDSGQTFIARGDDFPDALASGQLAGVLGATLVLENNPGQLGTNVTGYITDDTKDIVDHATLVGGTVALSNAVRDEVRAAFRARS